ncbi:hypothetical protein L3Q82_005989 [Scortum barcoo]|uniref:Uncharacterized protein n=1 Tax=Scortum barcoo TaxID=214431 RepID=A0ACB8X359_9TELE|nr:hypothetical protein L3Q82_005989 [Scortum barcoo]
MNNNPEAAVIVAGDFNHVEVKAVFPNSKLSKIPSTVKLLLKACDVAYRSGDKLAYSIDRKELKKGIKLAKSRAGSGPPARTKEVIVDYRRSRRTEHAPLLIHGEAVERVNNIKFLDIHITSDLSLVHEHSSPAASERHFSPGSPEETPLHKMLFLPAAALCCLCSALVAMAAELIQEDLTLTRRVGQKVSFSCGRTDQCSDSYVYWYQKKDTETFTLTIRISRQGGAIERNRKSPTELARITSDEQVVKPVVSVYPAASRAHLEGKSSLLCVSSAMFPPLVQFSWKRQKEDGPLEELPPAEGEQLELRESGRTAAILSDPISLRAATSINTAATSSTRGAHVEAPTEQEVSQLHVTSQSFQHHPNHHLHRHIHQHFQIMSTITSTTMSRAAAQCRLPDSLRFLSPEMSLLQSSKKKDKRVLSGTCPDPKCQARLFFPAHGSVSIECTECGQRHEQRSLLNVEEVTDPDVVLHNLLRNALLGVTGAPKKGTELVKVMGLSNYHCKLLSPVLTRYGMDKQTGKAKLLRDMNQGEMFDCSLLGDRAFLIEPDHVSTMGYGKDRSGSLIYLHDTLEEVKKANGNRECLIPVHVDGDGHCLVHAVSRALVGRELFWHALRENLKQNFKQNLDRYKALFQDFIDAAGVGGHHQ